MADVLLPGEANQDESSSPGGQSPSSIVAEATNSDSQEQLVINENIAKEVSAAGKERRINRRIALALEQQKISMDAPKLGGVLMSKNNQTIDLSTEDDDPTNRWFMKTFSDRPQKKPSTVDSSHPFAVPLDVPKNVPKSLKVNTILKKRLEMSMAEKRRKGLETRRQMYDMDNEHLRPEEEVVRKKKLKKKVNKPECSDDDDSENDEDYKEEASSSEGDESDEEENTTNDQSTDLFGNPDKKRADDEISVNLLNDSFTFDVYGNQKGPGSIVSGCDESFINDDYDRRNGVIRMPNLNNIGGELKNMDMGMGGGGDDLGDLLDLCSGRFGPTQAESVLPSSMAMSGNDANKEIAGSKINEGPSKSNTENEKSEANVENNVSDDDSDDEMNTTIVRRREKTKNTLDSDDEDEASEKMEHELNESDKEVTVSTEKDDLPETVPPQDESELNHEELEEKAKFLEAIDQESGETEIVVEKRRIVMVDDDEESDKEEDEDAETADGDDELEENEEEIEEDVEEEEEEEPEEEEKAEEVPNFDDEDDELAVIKRIEYQEFKTKEKKKTWFDDEASLSGDDVGSDVDDENDGENEYEAEEGDADDVPDAHTISNQNQRLLMKQENDKEQRALAKLQDRLLADGDLSGVETNRTFRFRIRDQDDAKLTEGADAIFGNDDDDNDDDAEEDEATKTERAQLLRFRLEQQSLELATSSETLPVNDPFERAARMVRVRKEMSLKEEDEDQTKNKRKEVVEKPSLLMKTTLATTIKEVLAAGGAQPKQMYVRSMEVDSERKSSGGSSWNGMKRVRHSSPQKDGAKRGKPSKLSSLE